MEIDTNCKIKKIKEQGKSYYRCRVEKDVFFMIFKLQEEGYRALHQENNAGVGPINLLPTF